MLDYIFFHLTPYQAFAEFLQDLGVKFRQSSEFQESTQEEGLMVILEQELDDGLLEKVEAVENPDERPLCKIE